jgi:hypothetical protein
MNTDKALTPQVEENILPPDYNIESELATLLKAASLLPNDEAQAHVIEQAGHLFDASQPHTLTALKLQLSTLEKDKASIEATLNEKQGEAQKLPRFISESPLNEEGAKNGEGKKENEDEK